MKRRATCILLTILLLFTMIPATAFNVAAAEDNEAPTLKSIKVTETSVKAGSVIKVKVTVQEEGTGLKKAFIQFNNPTRDTNMLTSEKVWATPVYSSGSNYITYTFQVSTKSSTRSGDWFIGYVEFYDSKGNFSRYCGSASNNEMYSEFLDPVQTLTGTTHVNIYGTTGDVVEPILNWIKIANPTVEKPGTLTIKANITEKSGLSYVQFDLSQKDESDWITKNNFKIETYKGTKTYTFSIPINKNRHNGEWQVTNLYLTDAKGNEAHYTTNLGKGYFVNYYNKADAFKIPTFKVIGVYGDETAPEVSSIRVLNDNETVQKPGVLSLELGLKEEESGITNIEVYIEWIDSETPDVKSRAFYRFSAKGYSYNDTPLTYSSDTMEVFYDKPLMTGTYQFNVPIASTNQNGTYKVYVVGLKDRAENTYENYADNGISANFILEDEFDYDFEVGISNNSLVSKIQSMETGKVGRILLSDNKTDNVLPKAALDAIAGQDKTLVCYKDGYQWIFRGENISPEKTKDLNLTTKISIISKELLSSGQKAVCLSFENNGELPGVVEFRFKSAFVRDFYGNEDELQLYHVDGKESGSDEPIDYLNDGYDPISASQADFEVVLDNNDSWCYLDLSHNSKYVVSGAKLKKLTMDNAKVTGISASYTYNGKTVKPKLKIKLAGTTLKFNKDYKVTYKNCKSVGTATVTIKGIGKYKSKGTKKITFEINPKGTSVKSVTAAKKAFTVKWKKPSATYRKQMTGYQIRYSTSSSMSNAKTVTVKKTTTTSRKITNLKAKKKYYVQVRTYTKVKGKTYYSKWSSKKSVKTK